MDDNEPQPVGTCEPCGEPIAHGAAFIENTDGALYHPDHYPDPAAEVEDPDTLDIPAEPAPKAKK